LIVPRPTDYDHMEAGAFNQHVDLTLRLIWSEIIPVSMRLAQQSLLREIDLMGI